MSKLRRRNGFATITTLLCLVAMLGMLGIAVDLGRMYIAKNEVQAYSDAAAIAAARELDGTPAGLARAQAAVSAGANRWNLGHTDFEGVVPEFSANHPEGPWVTAPAAGAAGVRFARVQPAVTVPLYFMPVAISRNTSTVTARSVAGQIPKTRFTEGLFPFSPFAHDSKQTGAPHHGLVPGQRYTLRWAASPRLNHSTCPGDNTRTIIDLAGEGGGEGRGYIEQTSAETIRAAIVNDHQTAVRGIGDSVAMTGGARPAQHDALVARINQDTDSGSMTYARYDSQGQGNGRRIVAAPVNAGSPTYTIVQIGAFFLLPAS